MDLSTIPSDDLFDVSSKRFSYLFDLIESEDLSAKYIRFFVKHPSFFTVCAGVKHHHWWAGGLVDHVLEIIFFMREQLTSFPYDYIGITVSDCIIVALLHDFDKIWTYSPLTPEQKASGKFHEKQEFGYSDQTSKILDGTSRTLLELGRAGIVPTDMQWSAVLFAHGGYSDANFCFGGATLVGSTVNHENKLAVLLNMADMFSSQVLGKSIA